MSKAVLPKHIAIIPDGNGRWAGLRGEPRIFGHVQGTANVKEIVMFAKELGVSVMTIYAFSDENWQRPKDEVHALMNLLKEYLVQESDSLVQNKIQLRAIGQISQLPDFVVKELDKVVELTKHHRDMVLNFAVSYGAQNEIISAVQKIARQCVTGDLKPEDIDKELFSKYLYMADLPYPDLLIRTSGELRVSNFLLWQIAYTEIYATDVLWPDFDRNEFMKAIKAFQKRERRFGMTSEQVTGKAIQHAV